MMGKRDDSDLSAEQQAARARFDQSARWVESTAIELVEAGRAMFKNGKPTEPDLQRRYRFYKRVEAALALPAGLKRVAALRAALTDSGGGSALALRVFEMGASTMPGKIFINHRRGG